LPPPLKRTDGHTPPQKNLVNSIFLVNNVSVYQTVSSGRQESGRVKNVITSAMASGAGGHVQVTKKSDAVGAQGARGGTWLICMVMVVVHTVLLR
jgi:hypothetical protein